MNNFLEGDVILIVTKITHHILMGKYLHNKSDIDSEKIKLNKPLNIQLGLNEEGKVVISATTYPLPRNELFLENKNDNTIELLRSDLLKIYSTRELKSDLINFYNNQTSNLIIPAKNPSNIIDISKFKKEDMH